MIFTSTYSGNWVDPAVTMTATQYFVFPPGFDCLLSGLSTVTLTKANPATAYAVGAVDAIGAGSILGLGGTTDNQGWAVVVTASGSGVPTVDCKVIPSVSYNYISTPGGSSDDLTVDGTPSERIKRAADATVPYDPAAAVSLFAGMDPAGPVSYYTSPVTAVAAKQIVWSVGTNRNTAADPTPALISVQECCERDVILTNADYSLPAPFGDTVAYVQATGTAYPGIDLFINQLGNAISYTASHVYPICLGTCVSVDRSQTPPKIGYVRKAFSKILTQDSGRQLAARIAIKREMVKFSNIYTAGTVQINYIADYGNFAYACVVRIVTSWSSSNNAYNSFPLTWVDVICPCFNFSPTFCIDVTLPSPIGASRIIWVGGQPQLCQQTSPSSAPSGMARQFNDRLQYEQNIGATGGFNRRYGWPAVRGIDGWADLPYPVTVYPGFPNSGSGGSKYGPTQAHMVASSPCRIGDISSLHLYRKVAGLYLTTNVRAFAQWFRLDAVACPNPSVGANDGQVACSSTQSIACSSLGGAYSSWLMDDDITIVPTGTSDDIGCFVLRTWLLADDSGGHGPYDILFGDNYFQPPPRGFWPGSIDCEGAILTAPYLSETTSSGSCRKIIWPVDVPLWQPFPNDANCSYSANTGWASPAPPRTASYGITGSFAVSWAGNQYTVSAMPTPTTTPATGAQFVRSSGTVPVMWYFRAKALSMHLRYGYQYGSVTLPVSSTDYAWFDDSNGERTTRPVTSVVPRNIPAANPSISPVDTQVELYLMASFYTDWGNVARYVPPVFVQTVTLT